MQRSVYRKNKGTLFMLETNCHIFVSSNIKSCKVTVLDKKYKSRFIINWTIVLDEVFLRVKNFETHRPTHYVQ